MDAALPDLHGGSSEAAFVDLLQAFIRFSADRPELDRIINLEATAPSERLEWLVATQSPAPLPGGRGRVGDSGPTASGQTSPPARYGR